MSWSLRDPSNSGIFWSHEIFLRTVRAEAILLEPGKGKGTKMVVASVVHLLNLVEKNNGLTCWIGLNAEWVGSKYLIIYLWASLAAQLVKDPPAMQETWVWFLGWEDPVEKGKANHFGILAWRIPWTV